MTKKFTFLFFVSLVSPFIYAQEILIQDPIIIPIHVNQLIKGKSVLIKNGRIAQIAPFSLIKKTAKTKVINAKGLYLMPGLADMHVHLPDMSSVDSAIKEQLLAGVTHIRVMNSELDQLELQKKVKENNTIQYPQIFTSFIIRRNDRFNEGQLDSLLISIKKQGYRFIKLFSVANEQTFSNLMKIADKHQMIVAGHFPSNLSMEMVLKTNFRSIEHLGGYTQKNNYENLDRMVEHSKNIFNCPTLNYFISEAKTDSTYNSKLYAVMQALDRNNCSLLVGSDLGGRTGMLSEMKIWENLGISRYTILKSATMNPALFFNESNQWGSIQVGREASLLLLKKNPLENIDHLKSIRNIFLRGTAIESN
jgi:imidazolonepropionase-like amidohydrolase